MGKLIQRYLGAHFVAPFVVSTSFFVGFLLTFQLFRITKIVINKGVDISTVLELVAHIAISFLPMAIPLSALFATIYTLNKLSEDSEIVAIRSFGNSKFTIFKPFLILGIIISAMVFALNLELIPYSKRIFKNTIIQLTSRGLLNDIRAGQFFTEIPNITLFAENVTNGGKKLEDVFIQVQNKKLNDEKTIFARKGVLLKQSGDLFSGSTMRLHLKQGNITKVFKDSSDVEKILFEEYDFPIVSGDIAPGLVTKDSMRTSRELYDLIIEKENTNADARSLVKTKLEFWSRINTPFQCLLFIFLGFSLGIKKGRGQTKNSSLMGMLVLIFYYSLFFTGVSFSRKGIIPPLLAVALPTILLSIFASKTYKDLDWAG
jgi:lipopolysaccharide export system permease protein